MSETTPSATPEEQRSVIGDLLDEAVKTDGAHHKQWFLEQIAIVIGWALTEHDEGIAP